MTIRAGRLVASGLRFWIRILMTRTRATLTGMTAIAMWASLALLTIGSAPVPPFLLNALCFGIGGSIGLLWVVTGAGWRVLLGVPLRVYLFGTVGLFGYHALYFSAFRLPWLKPG